MINWALRFKNKVTLVSLVGLAIAFVYQVLGIVGVVPPVSEDEVKNLCLLIIDILVGIGIVVDPTTKGLADSPRAMTYDNPKAAHESLDEIEAENEEHDEEIDEEELWEDPQDDEIV